MIIGNMRGRTAIRVLIAVVVFIAGWTSGQLLEGISPLVLEKTISLSEVLAILVEIGIAIIIASLVERGMQNQRVEKDFFISEFDAAQESLASLSKDCSLRVPLSLNQTVYQIEKPKKDLIRMWDTMAVRNKAFHDKMQSDFESLISLMKTLNSQLSDSRFFKTEDGFKPVSIARGTIHLNNTVSQAIDDTFSGIKECIFRMKIAVNEM